MQISLSTNAGTVDLTGAVIVTAAVSGKCYYVQFYINDVLVGTVSAKPFTYLWDTSYYAPGSYTLKATGVNPNAGGQNRTVTLAVTVASQAPPPSPPPPTQGVPVNTTLPVVTGTATEGQTLTVSTGVWTNTPDGYLYQWLRCDSGGSNCVLIASATTPTYTLVTSDVADTIRCSVSAYNAYGAGAAVQTTQTSVVSAFTPAVPTNTVLPVITGTILQGSNLSVSNGSWTGSPSSYAYQWKRCNSSGASCVNISGQTSNTYVLAAADVGSTVRCAVTASNVSGASTPASSAATAVVTTPPPGGLGVNLSTASPTGGTILRQDDCSQADPAPGLWGTVDCYSGNGGAAAHVIKVSTGGPVANGPYRRILIISGDIDHWNPVGVSQRTELGVNNNAHYNTGTQTDGAFWLVGEGARQQFWYWMRVPTGGLNMGLGNFRTVINNKQAQPYTMPSNVSGNAYQLNVYGGKIDMQYFWSSEALWSCPPMTQNVWCRVLVDGLYTVDATKGWSQTYIDFNGTGRFDDDTRKVSPVWHGATLFRDAVTGAVVPCGIRIGIYQAAVYNTGEVHFGPTTVIA